MKANSIVLILSFAISFLLLMYYIKKAIKEKTFHERSITEILTISRPITILILAVFIFGYSIILKIVKYF